MLWPLLSSAFAVGMMVWLALALRVSLDEWRRFSIVLLHMGVTFLPAVWASESVATLQALMDAGLEHKDLTRLKIEYLRGLGRGGANPTARRWAVSYIVVYVSWTVFVFSSRAPLGLDLLGFAFVHVGLVIGLAVLVTWRFSRFTKTAELKGYPFGKLAIELRRQRIRW